MTLPLHASDINTDGFAEWVEAQGWQRAAPTNEWEVTRYKSPEGWNIVYSTKKGGITWTGQSSEHYLAFQNGGPVSVPGLTRNERREIRTALFERDGPTCWYCAELFTSDDYATIEHLIPRSEGGGHQLANLVLAHKSCNQQADNAPLARKIEMRDRLQGMLDETPPWESVRAAS